MMPNRMDSMTVQQRRLFTLRCVAVLAYALTLPFPWYRSEALFGHMSDYKTGWTEGFGGVLPWLLAGLLVSGIRLTLPLARPARLALGLLGVGLGLATLISFLLAFGSPADERPAFVVAQGALLAYMTAAVTGAFVGRARSALAQDATTPHVEPLPVPLVPPEERLGAEELVLIVHGTGSAAEADEGDRWWQAGGALAAALERHLPCRVRVHRIGEVFHWSGANLESHRRAAGRALALRLRELGGHWQRVHVVAHSHGGSVAWHALRQLHREGALEGIGTVVTLGTPFLRLRPASGLPIVLAWIALFVVAVAESAGWLRDAIEVGVPAWLSLPGAVVGLSVVVSGLLSAVLVLHLAQTLVWTRRCRREQEEDLATWVALGPRLRCVWSRHDEAINGLTATTLVTGGLLVSPAPAEQRAQPFWRTPLQTLYDDMLGPVLDQVLWLRTARHLQGVDVPGTALDRVLPHPVRAEEGWLLPMELGREIDAWVADHSSSALQRAREVLGVFWATGTSIRQLTRAIGGQLRGTELVHWAYYQAPQMPELLAALVAERAEVPEPARSAAQALPAPGAARSLRLKASLAGAGLAVVAAVSLWALGATWHRTQVYPATERFAVALSLREVPVRGAAAESGWDELSRWFRTVARSGGAPVPPEPHVYRLLREGVQADRRRGALLFVGGEPYRAFRSACAAIHYGLSGSVGVMPRIAGISPPADASSVRATLASIFRADSPVPEMANRVVAPITDELLIRLRPRSADFMQTCLGFHPDRDLFLPEDARGPRTLAGFIFGRRNRQQDAYVGAAVFVATAWALDPRATDRLTRAVAAGPDEDEDPGVQAWAPHDLASLLFAVGDSVAVREGGRLLARAFENEAPEAKVAAVRVLCQSPQPEALESEGEKLRHADAEVLHWAIWRCAAESAARRGVEMPTPARPAGLIDEIEFRLIAAIGNPRAPVADSIWTEAWSALASDPLPLPAIRSSRIRCDAAVIAARAGHLREARSAHELCEVTVDRVRALTAVLESYARRHPRADFAELLEEADRLVPTR